jgi:hypothetical protein
LLHVLTTVLGTLAPFGRRANRVSDITVRRIDETTAEWRQIKLSARRAAYGEEPPATRAILFKGVEGYRFENYAFGNIIHSLEAIPVERLISQYGAQITESHRFAGAPGPWAADLTSAVRVLTAKGIKGFILTSSYGLSGWILAKEVLVVPD